MADATASDRKTLTVSVVTPEGTAYEGEAAHVTAPAFDGEVAFYPQHAPFVGVLGFGELRVTPPAGGSTAYFYVAGGVVQVADDAVTILAEGVIPTAELDKAAADALLAEAIAMQAEDEVGIDARFQAMEDARARARVAVRHAARSKLTAKQTLEQPVE